MRFKLKLTNEKETIIKVDYFIELASSINMLLDSNYLRYIENGAYLLNRKIYKPWTFSRLFFEKYSFANKEIRVLPGDSYLIVSTIDDNFAYFFLKGILKEKCLRVGEAIFEVRSVSVLNQPQRKQIVCRTLSPIIIKEIQRIENSCPEFAASFVEGVKKNLVSKAKAFRNINISPEKIEIQIVNNEKIKRKTLRIKNEFYVGYELLLKIKSLPEIIEIAYNCGLGVKNALGFGCVEIIPPPSERVLISFEK
ncbi:CRISPR-associated endoribonuclease Cas6 [Caldicellulosiruptor acetigenus]|uniref:CRISPR-associated endoribonuclease n=1 Tax=Caldicellulosiruptor acetigenus 6A TaxID=632516 RepID=G2PYR5_9FIRM|nr:CRISPR-associated endoribonuclease Cas6 [Caldicellulosiruptor acetigenus]AEM74984.1 CRISPR-associated protein Cas6 [Caldicellulosiruptor acetigenus 6A]